MQGPLNLQISQKLTREYQVLMALYGQVQNRCSALIATQAADIARLQAQTIRLRAAAILRETALSWEREDGPAVQAAIPDRSKYLTLAQQIRALTTRIQVLMRKHLNQPISIPRSKN